MLLLVGIGFEQQMIESASRERKNALGQLAYLDGLWRAVNTNTNLELQLTLDDQAPMTVQTHSLVVANAAPFTSLLAQGKGKPNMTDGLLDITWLDSNNEPNEQLISLAELAFTGWIKEAANSDSGTSANTGKVKHAHAKKVKISSQPQCKYVIDGEICEPEELNIDILPASLKVFVPYQAQNAEPQSESKIS